MRAVLRTPGRTFGALLVFLSVSLGGPARADVLSWVPTGLNGVEVGDVAVEPGGSGQIWAATTWRGLLVSTDGGKTFVPSPAAGLGTRVSGIDFDPEDSSVLYAATPDGLYRVTAATAERLWPRDLSLDPNARWVSVDPLDPRVLLLGATGGGIPTGTAAGAPTSTRPARGSFSPCPSPDTSAPGSPVPPITARRGRTRSRSRRGTPGLPASSPSTRNTPARSISLRASPTTPAGPRSPPSDPRTS